MQSVGTRLREARERKGFSLDEINARTCINSRNLEAIERDRVRDISSPFFYRSFVRQYAEQVDLDFRILAPGVEMLVGGMRQPDLPGQGEHQPVRVAPIQARPKRDYGWVLPTAVFVGLVALGSGGFAAWKFYGPSLNRHPGWNHSVLAAMSPKATISPKSLAATPYTVQKPDRAIAVTSPERTVLNPPTGAPISDSIHLKLAATERTWLTVTADGKPAYTGILEKAETKTLDGQETARLRTGNAGGVNITFNGKEIGAIGPRGKTRTVVFTRTGYEVQPNNANPLPANHIGG